MNSLSPWYRSTPNQLKTCSVKVLEFFNKHAEVRCVRMAGTEFDRAAYVEFTQQPSIIKAFGLMGATLNGRQIMVQHSNCAIIKPASNFPYFDEASKAAAVADGKSRIRSRSRDRRSRSRRRSSSRRRRSRSRERRRSRSRHGRRRSRTRSRSRGRRRHSRSVSRDRHRSNRGRSRSRERRKYHRSRSRSSRRRSRSRSRGRRSDRRDRDRGSVRSGRDRTRERDRRDRDYDKERRRERDYRRDSRSRKHRDSSPKLSSSLSESLREERREKGSTSIGSEGHAPSPMRPTSESGRSVTKRSRHDSSASSSRSENGSETDRDNRTTPQCQNGGENHISLPQSGSDDTSTQPVVVGVKLAGPEDMDNVSPRNEHHESKASPASNHSDSSGDAMDMEA